MVKEINHIRKMDQYIIKILNYRLVSKEEGDEFEMSTTTPTIS
jgi:hypothetical protein